MGGLVSDVSVVLVKRNQSQVRLPLVGGEKSAEVDVRAISEGKRRKLME